MLNLKHTRRVTKLITLASQVHVLVEFVSLLSLNPIKIAYLLKQSKHHMSAMQGR